jgi:hypothetical protein
MSNRSLLNLMRGGMSDFHVGRGSARDDGPVRFAGERRDRVVTHYTFAAHAMHEDGKHDYSKKENREMKSKKRSKDDGGSTTGDESESDTEGPKKKKGSPIHAKGSDADVIALYCSNTPSLPSSDPRAVPHRETARPVRARARRWTGLTRIATASPMVWRRRSEPVHSQRTFSRNRRPCIPGPGSEPNLSTRSDRFYLPLCTHLDEIVYTSSLFTPRGVCSQQNFHFSGLFTAKSVTFWCE